MKESAAAETYTPLLELLAEPFRAAVLSQLI